jgi:hypothetical protein
MGAVAEDELSKKPIGDKNPSLNNTFQNGESNNQEWQQRNNRRVSFADILHALNDSLLNVWNDNNDPT